MLKNSFKAFTGRSDFSAHLAIVIGQDLFFMTMVELRVKIGIHQIFHNVICRTLLIKPAIKYLMPHPYTEGVYPQEPAR